MIGRRIRVALVALAAVAVIATAVYANLATGTKAPNFTLPTIDGKTFKLADSFKKPPKVVVLDLWATWCPPCRAEIPFLIALRKEFPASKVTFVGVALDEEQATVADFAKEQGINYIVAHDPNGEKLGKPYAVRGIPATYIIDKRGVIRYVHSGFPGDPGQGKEEAAKIAKEIRSLLAK